MPTRLSRQLLSLPVGVPVKEALRPSERLGRFSFQLAPRYPDIAGDAVIDAFEVATQSRTPADPAERVGNPVDDTERVGLAPAGLVLWCR